MNLLVKLIITGVIAFGLANFLPGVHINSIWTGILLALILAVLDGLIKPLLIIFTLPLTILTLGFFLFVINAIIILLADALLDGFLVDGFWWALLFSLLLSFITSILFKEKKEKD